MARNGSGVYTKVNTFAATNPITASGHNQNWDDIATEITNSVAADGQTNMTGPLKASSGSLSNPSQTFAADTNTGRYRKASDTMADVCGGAEVVEYSSAGIDVTGDVTASGVLKQGSFSLLPVGVVFPYGGSAAPAGYLLCYGQAVDRDDYADLFGVIGTAFGAGDGSTTFNVPDMRGRVPAGA
ncbi:MAG TPA: phage tail protein, partial [Bryobacteraceae bacterium]|nr:phage tail protein [Bryobacteraceae bacterium]